MNKLPKNSLKEFQKQHLRLLSHKSEFQDRVVEIRKKWNIPEQGILTLEDYMIWRKSRPTQASSFDKCVQTMTKELNQIMNLFLPIQSYIVHGDFFKNPLGSGINDLFLRQNPRVFEEDGHLFMEIYDDTTPQDVKRIWKSIVEVNKPRYLKKGSSAMRRKPLEYFDRNERIYNLHREGKNAREICKIINQEFKETFLGYSEISPIIKRFEKEIQNA